MVIYHYLSLNLLYNLKIYKCNIIWALVLYKYVVNSIRNKSGLTGLISNFTM